MDLNYSASNGDDIGFILAQRALSTNRGWILPRLLIFFDNGYGGAIHELQNLSSIDLQDHQLDPMTSWVRVQQTDKAFFERARHQVEAALNMGSGISLASERENSSSMGRMAGGGMGQNNSGVDKRPRLTQGVSGSSDGAVTKPRKRVKRPKKKTNSIQGQAMNDESGNHGQGLGASGVGGDAVGGSRLSLGAGNNAVSQSAHMGESSAASGGDDVSSIGGYGGGTPNDYFGTNQAESL